MSAQVADGEVVLSARGLSKSFGPITACDQVDIDVRAGQMTAIVGDNGAGKTTLVRMLCGALRPDAGTISIEGTEVRFGDPHEARLAGVEAVHQTLALAPNLDAVSNIFLGREIVAGPEAVPFLQRLNEKVMRKIARETIDQLNVGIPKLTGMPVGQMSGGQRQSVAIARAAIWSSKVVVMDEPTAALGLQESRAVLDLVKRILARGVAVVMISHILPHVIELAHSVIVMRHGRLVADLRTGAIDMEGLIRLIVGVEEGTVVPTT